MFKLLENWKVFNIRHVFVACGQLFSLVSRRATCYETLCSSMISILIMACAALQ